jgi:hypothetical protein
MVVSADFEKEKQHFDQENIALSFYRNIARQNCSSDEGLKSPKQHFVVRGTKLCLHGP